MTENNNQPPQEPLIDQEILANVPEIPAAPELDIEQHLSVAPIPTKD